MIQRAGRWRGKARRVRCLLCASNNPKDFGGEGGPGCRLERRASSWDSFSLHGYPILRRLLSTALFKWQLGALIKAGFLGRSEAGGLGSFCRDSPPHTPIHEPCYPQRGEIAIINSGLIKRVAWPSFCTGAYICERRRGVCVLSASSRWFNV